MAPRQRTRRAGPVRVRRIAVGAPPLVPSDASITWRIHAGPDETVAVWDPPAAGAGAVFVCAHGAGGHMGDRPILGVTSALRERGIGTVRFNFFYRARKAGRPDPMPK